MARARYIRPQFFLHEVLAELEAWVRLLFIGLWTLADRAGRLLDRPTRIRAALFPYEGVLDVDAGLTELAERGFIQRYTAAGEGYIQINNWAKHQTPHHQEAASAIPHPPELRGAAESATKAIRVASDAEPKPHRRDSVVIPKLDVLDTPEYDDMESEGTRSQHRVSTESIRLYPLPLTPDTLSRHQRSEGATGLDEFLVMYPKRVKRDAAARAYVSVIESPDEHERLMAGLRRWLESDQWRRSLESDGGRFVPDPDRFLFERRYLDVPQPYQDAEAGGGDSVIEDALRRMKRPDREAA